MSHDFRDSQFGLTTERQFHINRMLRDYNPKLSLRRIPETDPAFREGMRMNPPKVFGVWEEGVSSDVPNWVFTLAEMSLDQRVLARIMENDMSRVDGDARMNKFLALQRSEEASKLKKQMEVDEARRDEMLWIGRQGKYGTKTTVRHRINGEDVILGDTIRPVRTKIR